MQRRRGEFGFGQRAAVFQRDSFLRYLKIDQLHLRLFRASILSNLLRSSGLTFLDRFLCPKTVQVLIKYNWSTNSLAMDEIHEKGGG